MYSVNRGMKLTCNHCGEEIDESHRSISSGTSNWCSNNPIPQTTFSLTFGSSVIKTVT